MKNVTSPTIFSFVFLFSFFNLKIQDGSYKFNRLREKYCKMYDIVIIFSYFNKKKKKKKRCTFYGTFVINLNLFPFITVLLFFLGGKIMIYILCIIRKITLAYIMWYYISFVILSYPHLFFLVKALKYLLFNIFLVRSFSYLVKSSTWKILLNSLINYKEKRKLTILIQNNIVLPPISTQHYLVWIRHQCEISFVTYFTFSKWLKKYYFVFLIKTLKIFNVRKETVDFSFKKHLQDIKKVF